jgi:ketosteroid isomerase-like protein
MSRNVDIVRELYDLGSLLEAEPEVVNRLGREYADDEFELHLPADYPEGEQVSRGREGMTALTAALRELWSEWRFVPERFLDAGDHVLVFALLIARGHESGVPIELETTHVWTFRDGQATAMRVYRDRAEALEAVGLRE